MNTLDDSTNNDLEQAKAYLKKVVHDNSRYSSAVKRFDWSNLVSRKIRKLSCNKIPCSYK